MWKRELEEPLDETGVWNGPKVTTDEMRQLVTMYDGLEMRKSGCVAKVN